MAYAHSNVYNSDQGKYSVSFGATLTSHHTHLMDVDGVFVSSTVTLSVKYSENVQE